MGVRGFESDILDNWAPGVITTIVKDRLPDGAVASSKNSQFYNIGPNAAVFGTRLGCELQNETTVGDDIVSQYFLNPIVGSDTHLIVVGDGSLQKLDSGVVSSIASSVFSNVDNQFSWQTANDLAYVVNGVDLKKTDGVDVWKFGIDPPDSGDWTASAVAGGVALPADDYDVAIAYYNSATNHTGPISDIKTVTIAGGQKLRVHYPSNTTIDDPQVDFVKIFIRAQSVSAQLFLVIAGTSPAITGTSGWAVGGSAVNVDIDSSAGQISAFEILAPDTLENYPPPPTTKFIISHKSRMFAFTATNVYWSELVDVEAFNVTNNTLPVGISDGEEITGVVTIGEDLAIFKQNAVYALIGDDPQSWRIQAIDNTVGCTSYNSIGSVDNQTFWMALKGPQKWTGVGNPIVDITTEYIAPNFDEFHVDPNDLDQVIAVVHPLQHYIGWAITPTGKTRNSVIIPYHTKLNSWMSSEWNMVDVRSCTVVKDSTGRDWPMVGDYDGSIYRLGAEAVADGLPSGVESQGTVQFHSPLPVVTVGAELRYLNDKTATWPVGGLLGRYVYLWNDALGVGQAQRRRIIVNTATVLELDTDWDAQPQEGDFYAIGGILFDWRSAFRNGGAGFFKKRIEFCFLDFLTSSLDSSCEVEVYTDMDETIPRMSRSFDLGGDGPVWDDDDWDDADWAGQTNEHKRIPIRKVGYSWQIRVLHMSSGEQLYVVRTGVQWLTKTKKVGGNESV